MGVTGKVKLVVVHYLWLHKIGVGERDVASKKYLQWDKNSLKRRQKGKDMKRGRDGGKKRMKGKNLLPNVSGPPLRSEEESKRIKKSKHSATSNFSVRGRLENWW